MVGDDAEDGVSVAAAGSDGRPADVCDHRSGAAAGRTGVVLSREQVYRLVTAPPQRLSMDTLVALCDILDCTPNDLIEPAVVSQQISKPVGAQSDPAPITPRRSVVKRPGRQ